MPKIVQLISCTTQTVALYGWVAPNGSRAEMRSAVIAWALLEDGSVAGLQSGGGVSVIGSADDPRGGDFEYFVESPEHCCSRQHASRE